MVSTKSTLIAIFAAALVSTTLAGPNYNGCSIIGEKGNCQECFERRLKLDGSGCGAALPKSNKCLFYAIGSNNGTSYSSCTTCKPGYANKIDFNKGNLTQKCVNATLSNCLLETDIVFQKVHLKTCNACAITGEYSVENKTTKVAACQKINNPVPNCKWGSIYSETYRKASCIRCEDGFAVNAVTRQCDKTVGTGCWV